MIALVTGGSGFIGTNLIKRLSNNNHVEYRENIIVSVDNYSTGVEKNDIDCPGVEYHFVDITEHTNYSVDSYTSLKLDFDFLKLKY